MTAVMDQTCPRPPGRRDAFLLVAALPLFLGALLCGWAYGSSEQIQWSNFASWLIAGGLVFAGIALACALVDLLHAGRRRGRFLVYFVLLLGTFAAGFVNSLVHARDAWAVMPTGLVLSAVVLALAAAATWIACSGSADAWRRKEGGP